jgi:HEAT repeat protein
MNHLLTAASDRREAGNWRLANRDLQQLLVIESDRVETWTESERELWLEMATLVLMEGDFAERWEIAKILPKLGKMGIALPLDILDHPAADLEARWFAARMLGEFDRPEAIVRLVKLLDTSDDPDLVEIAAQSLANIGKSAIAAVLQLLDRPEYTTIATRALAQIRRPEVIEPLLTVVCHPDVTVRTIAIEALGSFHQAQIVPVLIAALTDTGASVRKEAAIALGFRGNLAEGWNLLEHLQPLLYDLNVEVCQQAAIAISKLKTAEAESVLFRVLQSPHTPIPLQLTLIQALAWRESLSSLQYLHQALSHISDEGVLEIIRAIGRIETATLKAEAAILLLNFYHSGHTSLEEVQIKQALAHTWGRLGQKGTMDALEKLASDRDRGVRLHASTALKYLS